MTIDEIRARLQEIQAQQQEILDQNPGDISEEQQQAFDQLSDEFDKLTAQERRLVRYQAQQDAMSISPGPQTQPGAPRIETRERVEDDPNLGFRNLADVALAVKAACDPNGEFDSRLRLLGQPSNYHETSGSDGYMVPPAQREEIWELAMAEPNLFAAMNPEPTASNAVNIIADETTPWGATGVQANWVAEGKKLDASRLDTKGRTVKLSKLFAFVLATDELVNDAPLLNDRLTRQSARAISWKASNAVVEGSGAGMPLGFAKSNAMVTIPKEASQAAGTIVAKNVAKMYSRCIDPAMGFWIANQDVLAELMVMELGGKAIWTPPATGFVNAPGGILLGLPIAFSESCGKVGDVGDIYLVNPNGYYAANKAGGVSFAASIHLFFDYDMQAFRWTFRLGGQPFLSAPVTPHKSPNTRSHFIQIAERT